MKRKIILSILTLFCVCAVCFLGHPTPLYATDPGESCNAWTKCPTETGENKETIYKWGGWDDDSQWECCLDEVSQIWQGNIKTGTIPE